MCGNSAAATTHGRDESSLRSGQPAFTGSVQGGSHNADPEAGNTSTEPGIFHQLGKEFGYSISDDCLCGSGAELSYDESLIGTAENRGSTVSDLAA